jgi:hypothetical protein
MTPGERRITQKEAAAKRARERYAAKKAEGICTDTGCVEDATRGSRCLYHALKRRLWMRKDRAVLKGASDGQ